MDQGGSFPMVVLTIIPPQTFSSASKAEPLGAHERFCLHFPIDLNHCACSTTHIQQTVIVVFILKLSPCDSVGGCVPRDGSREAIRNSRGVAVCTVDKQAGSLSWSLLVPVRLVTGRDWPRVEAISKCTCPSWRY